MNIGAPYSASDRERFITEDPKNPARTEFERDRARVVHSSALRRLGEKTQVLGPSTNDFVRTRLTHSLEVAQVGRELGKELGADPDIVDAACLAHDLGHPPFGHNGEQILDELASDAGGFEGNAQTFRLLVRLEPKVLTPDGRPAGLNLTRATLDAVAKYPWLRGQGPDPVSSARKYCVYADDAAVFSWVRGSIDEDGAGGAGAKRVDVPAGHRCLEAQVMDLSDDIAYSVHDVEDAVATGKVDVSTMSGTAARAGVVASTLDWYGAGVPGDQLEEAYERLMALPMWMDSYSGSYADRAHLKDLTSQLIGRFCGATVTATRERFGQGPLVRHDADLVIPQETLAEIRVLKGVAVHYVMSPRESEPIYYQQRTLLADLVDALYQAGPRELEEPFGSAWREAGPGPGGEAGRLRAVIDQVANLTDPSAGRWHARLCGMLSSLM